MYFSGFIILLFVAVCNSLPTNSDGALSRQKRVIGGAKYEKGEYPFHVSLWYMGDNNPYTASTPGLHHTCGGSLVGQQWVLTSATCFDDTFLDGLGNTSLWRVYLGMHAQTDAEADAQYHTIGQIFTVPEYDLSETYGDLSLLKLDTPASLDSSVAIVGINDDKDCPEVDQKVDVVGWGQTQNHTYGLGSDVPYVATVDVSSLLHCQDRYLTPEIIAIFGGKLRIDERNLCAGVKEGGVDSCYGDLGSPLLAKCGKAASKPQVVAGMVSYGLGCAKPDYPAVYTRVSAYYEWIQETMEDN